MGMVTLHPLMENTEKVVYLLCNMGMTGFFEVAPKLKARHRHAHLSFHATDGSVLSFVDVRRFGSWRCMDGPEWPADRGPDPVAEHAAFRSAVVKAVTSKPHLFADKPICQVLHDQSIFNGIGNYLRAEVLFRAGVPPFEPAKAVLLKLPEVAPPGAAPDILTLCRDVPKEVIDMNLSKYQGGPAAKATGTGGEHERWQTWLRVYSHDDASWAVDQEGRRIWFRGPPGRLYAKCSQKGHLVKKKPRASPSPLSNAAKRDAARWFSGTPAAAKTKSVSAKKNIKKNRVPGARVRKIMKRPAAHARSRK